jgi:hypothetical protein
MIVQYLLPTASKDPFKRLQVLFSRNYTLANDFQVHTGQSMSISEEV